MKKYELDKYAEQLSILINDYEQGCQEMNIALNKLEEIDSELFKSFIKKCQNYEKIIKDLEVIKKDIGEVIDYEDSFKL